MTGRDVVSVSPARWVVLENAARARGYAVHILYDLTRAGPKAYAVAQTLEGSVIHLYTGLTLAESKELFDALALTHGPRGDPTWRAVLARLEGKPAELPGVWYGSIGEYAARYFAIGSWEWVEALVAHRAIQEGRRDAAESHGCER